MDISNMLKVAKNAKKTEKPKMPFVKNDKSDAVFNMKFAKTIENVKNETENKKMDKTAALPVILKNKPTEKTEANTRFLDMAVGKNSKTELTKEKTGEIQPENKLKEKTEESDSGDNTKKKEKTNEKKTAGAKSEITHEAAGVKDILIPRETGIKSEENKIDFKSGKVQKTYEKNSLTKNEDTVFSKTLNGDAGSLKNEINAKHEVSQIPLKKESPEKQKENFIGKQAPDKTAAEENNELKPETALKITDTKTIGNESKNEKSETKPVNVKPVNINKENFIKNEQADNKNEKVNLKQNTGDKEGFGKINRITDNSAAVKNNAGITLAKIADKNEILQSKRVESENKQALPETGNLKTAKNSELVAGKGEKQEPAARIEKNKVEGEKTTEKKIEKTEIKNNEIIITKSEKQEVTEKKEQLGKIVKTDEKIHAFTTGENVRPFIEAVNTKVETESINQKKLSVDSIVRAFDQPKINIEKINVPQKNINVEIKTETRTEIKTELNRNKKPEVNVKLMRNADEGNAEKQDMVKINMPDAEIKKSGAAEQNTEIKLQNNINHKKEIIKPADSSKEIPNEKIVETLMTKQAPFENKKIDAKTETVNELKYVKAPEKIENRTETASEAIVNSYAGDKKNIQGEVKKSDTIISEKIPANTKAGSKQNSDHGMDINNKNTKKEVELTENVFGMAVNENKNREEEKKSESGIIVEKFKELPMDMNGARKYGLKKVSDASMENISVQAERNINAVPEEKPVVQPQKTQYVDYSNIIEQVNSNIKTKFNQETKEMRIKLSPEDLGELEIKIKIENNIMKAEFTVESQIVKEALESRFDDLKQTLQDKGFNSSEINVNVSSGGNENSGNRREEIKNIIDKKIKNSSSEIRNSSENSNRDNNSVARKHNGIINITA